MGADELVAQSLVARASCPCEGRYRVRLRISSQLALARRLSPVQRRGAQPTLCCNRLPGRKSLQHNLLKDERSELAGELLDIERARMIHSRVGAVVALAE